MADLIDAGIVARLAPALNPEDQSILLQAVNAEVRRVAPCFAAGTATTDASASARWTVVRAVERLAQTRGWIRREQRGPFMVEFGNLPATMFTAAEESALANLCGTTSSEGGGRGAFPDPIDTDRILGRMP